MTSESKPIRHDTGIVQREGQRNFFLVVINGIIFTFAEALLDPTLVLVGFVSHLTQNPILLGLVLPIRDGSWALPQLWVAGFLQNRPLKIRVYQQMSTLRIAAWFMLALSMGLIRNPNWMLIAFFVSFSIASLASGIGGLPFLEVVSKTIPPQWRGEMFAWRLGAGGLLGIGGSFIVRWFLSESSPFSFPNNYAGLALGYFVFASISLLLFNRIREEPDENPNPRRKIAEQFHIAIGVLLSNSNYRRLVTTQALMILSTMAIPFYAILAQQEFQVDPQWVGTYLGVLMISNLLSNIVLGRISKKTDNQKVMRLAATAGCGMILVMLLLIILGKPLHVTPTIAAIWLIPVFFLSGVRGTGFGIASSSLLLNLAEPEERSLMIGFTQFLMGIVILTTSASGFLIKLFGFTPLIVITLLTQIGAWFVTNKLRDKTFLTF
ncbi:MAG TPA: MFS transporter [Longilinea sp.]|nr:MFS transporter [Longilinea sp.]